MKESRQKRILKLISDQPVETQRQLQQLLERDGVSCSQPTLSRDLHALGLTKREEPGGGSRYAGGASPGEGDRRRRLLDLARMSVRSAQAAENLIVLKTLPGFAGAAASLMDHLGPQGLVGSIAGDDTIMLVMRDRETARRLLRLLRTLLARETPPS